jgi:hypothetical protein
MKNYETGDKGLAEHTRTPYELGYAAYDKRKGVRDNPYTKGSKAHDLWLAGWLKNDHDTEHSGL